MSATVREHLAAIAADRNRPRKHVERARVVLASADRHSAQRTAQIIGISGPTVWRWQQRFAETGVDGLLRDKTRKPGKTPMSEAAARNAPSSAHLPACPPPAQSSPASQQSGDGALPSKKIVLDLQLPYLPVQIGGGAANSARCRDLSEAASGSRLTADQAKSRSSRPSGG